MHENELWITRIFNDRFSELGNAALQLVGLHPEPRPWANFIVMQFLVAALLVVVFAVLRARLSATKPGKLQQVFELYYGFVRGQAESQMGHAASRYLSYFGTIFIFILICNLIGVIPAFESPTMNAPVTLGCALATFLYYHLMGVSTHGFKYILQFMGPKWWLAFLMFCGPHLFGIPGAGDGAARIREPGAGLYIYAAHDVLRELRGLARTLIPA